MLQEKYHTLFEKLPHAFAYHKIVLDSNGKPVDYVFEDINLAFEEMTGLKKGSIIGRKVTEVLPDIDKAAFNWIRTYGKVASTGRSVNFEQYSEPLGKWYEVTAFSDEKGYFATIFLEITESIEEKEALKDLIELSEQYFAFSRSEIDYKKVTDTMLKISNAKYVAFNLYNEEGTAYTTVAVSSDKKHIKAAESILGFKIVGKEWFHDPIRAERMSGKSVARFSSLSELTHTVIPMTIAEVLERIFDVGEVNVASIIHGEKMLGDFTVFMPNGKYLHKQEYVKILSELTGQYIERKKAEERLQEKTDELEGFFNVVIDLLCIADLEGNFIRINQAWSDTLGYPLEEIQKRKFLDFVHPDDMAATLEAISKLGKQEIVQDFTNRYRAKDGTYRDIEWRSHPKGDLIYAAARDVTKRNAELEKLSAEHKQMLSIFDSMHAFIYAIDMNTYEILFVNKFGVDLYGDIQGKICWKEISANQQGPCVFCTKDELLQNLPLHKSVEREYYNEVTKKWYSCTDSAIVWTDDRIVKLHVAYDITERKKAEEQNQFISAVMMNIFDSVIITDTKQIITYVNKGTEELFGYQSEELIGQSVDILSADPNAQQINRELYQAVSNGNIYWGEELFFRKDRSTFFCEYKVAPINGADGLPHAYVGTQRDITERREKLKEIEYLSFHDYLTGLYNRRYLEDAIARLDIERNLPFAIIVIDVNGLKRVNDTYGHEAGDQFIKTVADILKTSCRADDIIARTGGDEFVIILPNTSAAQAESIKKNINDLASKAALTSGTLSLAVGYAVKTIADSDIKEVMKEADNKMYQDKIAYKSKEPQEI